MIKKLAYIITSSITLLTIFSLQVCAVPAVPSQIDFSQPSGEKFKAVINGDEKFNWVSTTEGDVLVQDTDKYWKYAKIESKKLKPSKMKYKIDKTEVKILKKDIINAVKQKKLQKTSELSLPASAVSSAGTITETSTQSASLSTFQPRPSEELLVVLVEFTDTKATFSSEMWASRFFGTTGSTVNNYYQEVSNNTFKFLPAEETNSTSNDGVIKVSLNYSHPNTAGQIDYRNQKIVYDALNAADSYIDFSTFDKDSSGTISPNELHIITVIAGYDRSASSITPSVWGHSWSLYGSYYAKVDGVGISKYTQMGEKISYGSQATIGLPCHELGHDLGLPDLYDYGYDSYGLGIYSLMAGGSWNAVGSEAPGSSPAHMDAFSKIKIGFASPDVVSSGSFSVNNFITNQYNILKINTSDPKQYFLLENRQYQGFDKPLEKYLKRAGIAVYHVNEAVSNNDDETKKLVDLEEANEGSLGYSQLDNCYGGYGNSYDHYYSSTGFSQISASTNPNTNLYGNIATNHSFKVISAPGNSMYVKINESVLTTLSVLEAPLANSVVSRSAAISGWLLEPEGVQEIKVSVDGTLAGKAFYGDPRADIYAQYPTYKNPNSGFHFDLDTSKYSNGSHTLTVTELTGTGTSKQIGSITLKVLNGVTISYKLSMDSYVNVKISDDSEVVVKTIENYLLKKEGYNSLVWDGNNDAGTPVRNGIYNYIITAKSNYGMVSTPATGKIIVGDYPEIISVSDSPDPFAPKDGAVNTINFRITEKAKVTIQLFNSNGTLMKTLIDKELEAGTSSVPWKGDDESGNIAADGTYRYFIDAVNSLGKKAAQVSGEITIDTVPPSIESLKGSPSVFNPYASKVQITFVLSKNAKTTIDVYDSTNNLVKRVENSIIRSGGQNQALWDGKNTAGTIVPNGTYILTVSAESFSGIKGEAKSTTCTVKSEEIVPPVISGASFQPNPFNPSVNSNGTISFNYSKPGYISIQILNSSNSLVKEIAKNAYCNQGANTFFWDGKDALGKIVSAGAYSYNISGIDMNEQIAKTVSGTITVLGPITLVKPLISNISDAPDPINPDLNQKSTIQYTVSTNAPIKINIYNKNGSEVVLLLDQTVNAGVNSAVWSGINSAGAIVESGVYIYRIKAYDSSGQITSEASGQIIIDRDPPSILVDDVQPNPFEPIE